MSSCHWIQLLLVHEQCFRKSNSRNFKAMFIFKDFQGRENQKNIPALFENWQEPCACIRKMKTNFCGYCLYQEIGGVAGGMGNPMGIYTGMGMGVKSNPHGYDSPENRHPKSKNTTPSQIPSFATGTRCFGAKLLQRKKQDAHRKLIVVFTTFWGLV